MATIYQTGRSKNWYISYAVDGRRVRESLGTTSKEIAKEKLRDIENRLSRQDLSLRIHTKDALISDRAKAYLVFCETNHGHRTTAIDKIAMNKLNAFAEIMGATTLSNLTPGFMEAYKNHYRDNRAPATINRDLNIIKAFVTRQVDEGYLPRNPFKSDGGKNLVKKLPEFEKKVRFLSVEEITRLLDTATELWKPVIGFALNTGIRRSELQHLPWEAVNIENRSIVVANIGQFTTKSRRVRHIPLNNTALRIIEGIKRRGNYVFGGDKPFLRGKFNNQFKAIRDAAGLQDVGFHTLRHTFASHLVMAGVPIVTVQSLLGHSNVQTTMIYAHLSKDHRDEAVKKLTF